MTKETLITKVANAAQGHDSLGPTGLVLHMTPAERDKIIAGLARTTPSAAQVEQRDIIAKVIARHFNDDRPTGVLPADVKLADVICAALTAAAQAAPPTEAYMRAFGANEAACYKWPDDTSEHKACRAAYCQGAADYGGAAKAHDDVLADNARLIDEIFHAVLALAEAKKNDAEFLVMLDELFHAVTVPKDAYHAALFERLSRLTRRDGSKQAVIDSRVLLPRRLTPAMACALAGALQPPWPNSDPHGAVSQLVEDWQKRWTAVIAIVSKG